MKNISKLLALAAILIMTGFTTNVIAQSTATNNSAGANIITPITLSNTASLNFGSMAVLAATPGTCRLSTTGNRSATGGVNLSSIAPVASNAAFHVTGSVSTPYGITLPATITVTKAVTLETMTIGTLLARATSTGEDGLTGTLSEAGTDDFTVGGILTVAAGQVGGVYSGTFDVTVAYN